MLAYVNLIQRKEKEIGCDVLTHQKWSGANYIDRILTSRSYCSFRVGTHEERILTDDVALILSRSFPAISSGSSSTSATGKDSTEHSF